MIINRRLVCITFLVLCLQQACSTRSGFGQIAWTHSLADARVQAAQKKLIITDLYADWCPWCKKMDAETWIHPEVLKLQGKYAFLKLNAEKEPEGIQLRKKFGVEGFPTVMLLNPDGTEYDRLEGYLPAEKFLARLNAAVADPESLGNLKLRAAKEPNDLGTQYKLGKKLVESSYYREGLERLDQVVAQDPGNRSGYIPNALFYVAISQASEEREDKALGTIDRILKDFPKGDKAPEALLLSGEILINLGRKDEARVRLERFLKTYPDHPMGRQAKQMLAEI
jgi:TolA-binding protein